MKKKILIAFLIIVVGSGLLYSAFNGLRWFVCRLSILKNGKQPKRGDIGNTYINDYEFDVEWKENDTLMVNNTTTINFKQETKVNGVEVIYKYYGD